MFCTRQTASFSPYGVPTEQYVYNNTVFGFTGQETDASGLQYLRARYYNPATGSFLTRDPVAGVMGSSASYNPYLYGFGSPTNYTHPSGRFPWLLLVAAWFARGFLVDVGVQMTLGGRSLDEVDWGSAVISGGIDVFTGGLGSYAKAAEYSTKLINRLDFAADVALSSAADVAFYGENPLDAVAGNLFFGGLFRAGFHYSGRAVMLLQQQFSGRTTLRRRYLSRQSGIIYTGVERFDALAVKLNNQDYLDWKMHIESSGIVTIRQDPEYLRLRGAEATSEIPDKWKGGRIGLRVDPNVTRYIALLHEEVHINQYLSLREEGVDYRFIRNQLSQPELRTLRDFWELEAYEFELDLARREGFTQKYIDDLVERRGMYCGQTQQEIFANSELVQRFAGITARRP